MGKEGASIMTINWLEREIAREYHPVAALFPLMEGAEFEELKADIAANGLLEAIWIDQDGAILDGRNRHRACIETETQPEFRTWSGSGSLVSFVVSMNLHRRHLSSSQRGMIATDVLPMLEEEARERQGARTDLTSGKQFPEVEPERPRDQAAAMFQTNPRYVQDAKRIRQEAPDLADDIRRGDKTIPQAKRVLKERKRETVREQNRTLVENTVPLVEWDGQPVATIVIDPPWDWGDEGDCDQLGRARPTYATMPFEDILALPIPALTQSNAHIYLWITNRSLPKGFVLLEAWGFRYITALTWCKPSFGMGNYFRGQTEHVLFGVRGSLPLLRKDQGTWFAAPRPGQHSGKPGEFYGLVERCSPGPWMEMFQRTPRPGWIGWGAEV